MREGGEDDDKGMVSDIESGPERDIKILKGWDLCLCGSGRGDGIDGSNGGGGVDGSGGNGGVGDGSERLLCIAVVGGVGVLCVEVLEVDCAGEVDILVLGGVFVVEVVEGVELVTRCVLRLVLWCVEGRGYFLCCFSLKSVKMNRISVAGFLFGMGIWADCFVLSERGFLGKMVGTDVLMSVVPEVVVVEAVDVVQAGSFVFLGRGCLGDMMGVRVVI